MHWVPTKPIPLLSLLHTRVNFLCLLCTSLKWSGQSPIQAHPVLGLLYIGVNCLCLLCTRYFNTSARAPCMMMQLLRYIGVEGKLFGPITANCTIHTVDETTYHVLAIYYCHFSIEIQPSFGTLVCALKFVHFIVHTNKVHIRPFIIVLCRIG